MKLLAFAASSSTRSINKRLVTYAASLLPEADVEIIDLNDYEMPLFSEDREREDGYPEAAYAFLKKIAASDALIISFAEHNASYTVAYKNILDWCSRIDRNVFMDKPVVMLSASQSRRGGSRVLETAVNTASGFAGRVTAHMSFPRFRDNFDFDSNRLIDPDLDTRLKEAVLSLL
ncbi:NAD(P)H-dependent oxidoreductase [bacterium]|nr:NAD(P)H-dependent oxidoreductase [bacterium]